MSTNQTKWKGRLPSMVAFTQIFGEGKTSWDRVFLNAVSNYKEYNRQKHSKEIENIIAKKLSFKTSAESMRKAKKIKSLADTDPEAKKIWDAHNRDKITLSKAYNILFPKYTKQVLISLSLELWGELETRAWGKKWLNLRW